MNLHRSRKFGWLWIVIVGALVISLEFDAQARGLRYTPLSEKVERRLSDEGRAHYTKAMDALDHINYVVAMEHINEAVKADPNILELRFLAIQLSKYHAQMNTGVVAVRFYDIALEHAKAVLKAPNLPGRQARRAEYDIERVTQLRSTVDERDQKRRTYGLQVIRQYASEVYTKEASSAQIKAFEDAVKSLTEDAGFLAETKKAAQALAGISAASPATMAPPGTEEKAPAPAAAPAAAAEPSPFDDAAPAESPASASPNPFDD